MLSQIQDDGTDKPISFASRSFNKSERNKPIIELELLAIFYAIMYFKPYIYGTHFLVRTDHKPLVYLFNLKNPSQRLLRIRLDLEEYQFDVEYIKGSKNVVVDALSRMSFDEIKDCHQNIAQIKVTTRSMQRKHNAQTKIKNFENDIIEDLSVYEDANASFNRKIPKLVFKEKALEARMNRKLLFKMDLSTMIRNGKLSLEKFFSQLQNTRHGVQLFHMSKDSAIFDLCTIEQFKSCGLNMLTNIKIALTNAIKRVTSEEEKNQILNRYHNDKIFGGHCGRNRLYAKLRSEFYWKGMSKDVARVVKTCPKCQLTKIHTHTKEKMKVTATPQKAFDVVIVDTIGPMNRSTHGNSYAVTLMCDLTKYVTIIPIPNKEAQTVARAILEYFILKDEEY